MKRNLGSFKEYFLIGASVFAMHFGGSSMIWPVTWGKESGSKVLETFSGVFITALLFVILGYLALSNANASLYQLVKKVSPLYSKIFITITILVMGPLFLIPRMSAASWDAIVQVFGFEVKSQIITLLFSIVYYLISYWFISDPSGVIDKLSAIVVPILTVSVIAIIIRGLWNPVGIRLEPSFTGSAFRYGFTGGYATGEVICALIYGSIVVNSLRNKGVEEKSINMNLLIVASIGVGILTITHLGHMLIGSYSGQVFPSLNYSALYSALVVRLWGQLGGVVFNLALLFAALTTAVGLAASTAEITVEVLEGKIEYKKAAIFILALSTLVSVMGLNNIVELLGPILDILYPASITLVIFYSLFRDLENKKLLFKSYRVSMVFTLIWGILEGIILYGEIFEFDTGNLEKVLNFIPGSKFGIGYLTVVLVITIFIVSSNKFRNRKMVVNHN